MQFSILDKNTGTLSHFKDAFIAQRMMSMGITPGSKLSLIRSMPHLGAYYIKADNKHFAMREEEVRALIVV